MLILAMVAVLWFIHLAAEPTNIFRVVTEVHDYRVVTL